MSTKSLSLVIFLFFGLFLTYAHLSYILFLTYVNIGGVKNEKIRCHYNW